MPPDLNLRVLPRTVQQETVEKLRLAIFSGVFEPGSRLIESQLCVQLGISRPSLREALRSLAAERLIAAQTPAPAAVATECTAKAMECWDVHYAANPRNYKDRRYLHNEFPQLLEPRRKLRGRALALFMQQAQRKK